MFATEQVTSVILCKIAPVLLAGMLTCRHLPTETEPLPPELQPLVAPDNEGAEANATDPVVQLFLKRQRRMKEVKKRREAGVLERLERFAVKKYYTMRRG